MTMIKETQNYKLELEASTESGSLCYKIKNKLYNVNEIETYLLPQAIKHLYELQAALDSVSDPSFFEA